MKISEAEICELEENELESLVFGYKEAENIPHCEAALVLGTDKANLDRTPAAVECYKKGMCDKLIFSGGVEWETEDGKLSEAKAMKKYAVEHGVNEDDIILDELAQTTIENMICGALAIQREYEYVSEVKNLLLVTSEYHMRRSLLLADALLPRCIKVYPVAAKGYIDRSNWRDTPESARKVAMEALFMQAQIENGLTEDGEF